MKFIHLADVHLGCSPDAGCPWSKTREKEIWETFRQVIEDAREMEADLLLIAGDLFHRQPDPEQLREVNYLFASIPKTRVVLIAGNHDYLQPSSHYLTFPWAPNVAALFGEQCECVRFPEIGTEVYGFSYYRQEILEPRYDQLHPVRGKYFQILLAHGGDARHIPIDRRKIAYSGFDYIALGHIHRPGALVKGKAIYSGALEPIDSADYGPHGYIAGEWKHGHLSIRMVTAAKREYRTVTIPCVPEDTTFSVRDRLEQQIDQEGWQHIYHVVLEGERDIGQRFDLDRLREYGQILDVEDRTKPMFHLEELKREYRGGIIEAYISSFEGDELSDKEEKALRYGLEALLYAAKEA